MKISKKIKYRILIALKLSIASLLITFILQNVELSDIWSVLSRVDKLLVASAFLLYFIGICITATRWKLLLSAQGVNASFYQLIKSMIVAIFFNNFMPSTIGGDAMRAYDTWKLGGSKTQSVSVVLIDRFLGIFTLLMFALFAILISSVDISFIPAFRFWIVIAVLTGIGALYVLFFKANNIVQYLHKNTTSPVGKLQSLIQKLFDVFAAFNGRKGLLSFALLLSFLLQLNVILHYYLLALSLNIDIPVSAMFYIIPVAIVVMMIPVTINAIGIRELIFVSLFAIYGISKADALAFSWLSFLLVTLLGIIGGLVFMFRKKLSSDNEEIKE